MVTEPEYTERQTISKKFDPSWKQDWMHLLATAVAAMYCVASEAQADSKLEGRSKVTVDLGTDTQNIIPAYSGTFSHGANSVNFAFSTELHSESDYNAINFQISYQGGFPISQRNSIALTFPITLDAHPEAGLTHYAVSPRLALLSSFSGRSSLTTFVEFGIDRGNIKEQHHSTRTFGVSFNSIVDETLIEISSSIGALSFDEAEKHATFSIFLSATHPLSENVNFIASAGVGRDLEVLLRDGNVTRSMTAQKNLSLSFTRTTGNLELSPYVRFTDTQSAVFHEKDMVAGVQTSWKF